jgi:membrane-anchored protein YejM (alkaline phosphatase superfamily)
LATKPSHVGVDVDGLAFPLHYPMTCSYQMRRQGFLPGASLSHHSEVVGGAFSGDVRPLGLDI